MTINMQPTEHRTIKLQKLNLSSISTDDNPCNAEDNYGYDRCKHLQKGQEILQIFGCRLPWMNSIDFGQDFDFCKNASVVQKARLEATKIHYKDCNRFSRCNRAKYQIVGSEVEDTQTNMKSKLTLQFANTDVQVVKDFYSYDAQSLIGEVGGTLGLLLGMSFMSIFDLINFAISVLEN